MRNYQHLLTKAFNTPLAVDASYARVFFSGLSGRIGGVDRLIDLDGNVLDSKAMQDEVCGFSKNRPESRSYHVTGGIAVIPIDGSLVHKLGTLHPYSGMTGYDGVFRKLNEAMSDSDVRGVLLDIDSPGGMVSGCFDLADMIARFREIKPIWSLGYDMHCSAAQMIASSCSRRLITQTGVAGSVGVIMAHTNIKKLLENQGVEITLIKAGKHKADGNPYDALPKDVQAKWESQLESVRTMFATKAANYMGKSVGDVLATEAECFEGQAAVDIGFANEVVNGYDAVAVMIEHLDVQKNTIVDMGASMTKGKTAQSQGLTEQSEVAPQAAAQSDREPLADSHGPELSAVDAERGRVLGIISLPEAAGREALANKLASNPAIDVAMAKDLLSAAPAAAAQRDDQALAALGQEHGSPLGMGGDDADGKDAAAVSLLVNS
ncbi:MAG: S49 family peptidase [Vibrio sp.]